MTARVRPLNPHGAPHAVQQAHFLFFPSEVFNTALAKARVLEERSNDQDFRRDFAAIKDVQGLTLTLGQSSPQVAAADDGAIFEGFDDQGRLARQLFIHSDRIQFTTTKYERWNTTWPMVERIANLILPPLRDAGVEFQSLMLQFDDAFEVESPNDNGWIDGLFDPDTIYLSDCIRQINTPLWHSNIGFFEFVQEIPGRVLTNVNISVQHKIPANLAEGLVVSIVASHRLDFSAGEKLDATNVRGFLDALHQLNKRVMRNLLSQEMRDCIQLDGLPGAGA